MIRRWWFGAAVVCLLASVLFARQGTVKTTDGRSIQGDIDETSPDGRSISVSLRGVTITLPRADVASIDYSTDQSPDNDQVFQEKLSKLDPNDVAGRISLAQEAMRAGKYDEATAAAQDAQRINPNDSEVASLLNTIAIEKGMAVKQTAAANTPAAAIAPAPATQPASLNPDAGKYLSDDDIQAIRRAELLPTDNARIQFFNNVRKRYLTSATGVDSGAYYNESSVDQALDIFESGNTPLLKDVKIISDPSVLMEYRVQVQPRILAGCAASNCHGKEAAGGFYLFSDAVKTEPAYTNFYILEQTTRKVQGGDLFGTGPVRRSMIDRVHVGSSLLLQFGLPRSIATIPHPAVAGFKPIFGDETDAYFVEVSGWISTLKAMAPDYGIRFTIPTGSPATRPASDAAANPG